MITDINDNNNTIKYALQQYKLLLYNNNKQNKLYVTQTICCTILLLHICNIILSLLYTTDIITYISLSVNNVFYKYYIWTIITSNLYNNNILLTSVTIILLPLLLIYCERLHQSIYTIKLILYTTIPTSILFLLRNIVLDRITTHNDDDNPYLHTYIINTISIITCLLLCIVHDKSNQVILIQYNKLKYKHIIPTLNICVLIIYLLTNTYKIQCVIYYTSLYLSYIYIKYFIDDNYNNTIGDINNNDFVFSNIFIVNILYIRNTIDIICNQIYNIVRITGLFSRAIQSQSSSNTVQSNNNIQYNNIIDNKINSDLYNIRSSNDTVHIEQRRLNAIKRIDEKLAELAKQQQLHSSNINDNVFDIDINSLSHTNGSNTDDPINNDKVL